MKNISISNTSKNPYTSFDIIMSTKKDGLHKRKTTVLNLKADIIRAYKQFEIAFTNNKLGQLVSSSLFQNNKDALIHMYSYEDKELQEYKMELLTSGNFEDDECPLCQIDTISCFDHFLPKSKFPEFAINIYNLIPSCNICNSKKSETFLDGNNNQKYFNVFLDKVPSNKHFLHLKYNKKNIPIFFIDNFDGMDPVLYERIKNTFSDLLILQRYNKRMYKEIQSLRTIFKNFKFLSYVRIRSIINTRISESEHQNGETHWKTLLYKELVINNNLLNYIINTP